jgi:hypothetical protein
MKGRLPGTLGSEVLPRNTAEIKSPPLCSNRPKDYYKDY